MPSDIGAPIDIAALSDAALAALAADRAGAYLRDLRDQFGLTGKALGQAGDEGANRLILATLAEARPNDAILSEESADSPARLQARRVWIVDPLDGTREYSEGRDDWAVHVALACDGVADIGAVALPSADLVLRSDAPATLPAAPATPRMVVSRTRPAAEALYVAEKLDAELIPMGSAGAKAMAVLRGAADIYLHSGGQYEWDNAAPVAVAMAAGLHCSRIDGAPMRYNNADVYLPDLLICRQQWAAPVLQWLADRPASLA